TAATPADLADALAALTFNPRDLAAGASEDIAITVTVTDDAHTSGGTGQTGTVTVHSSAGGEPQNEAPTDLNLSNNWAREWARNGSTIGSFDVTDADGPSGPYTFKFVIGMDENDNPILSDQDAGGR